MNDDLRILIEKNEGDNIYLKEIIRNSIILVRVDTNSDILQNIKVLKSDGIVYSLCKKSKYSRCKIDDEDILKEICSNDFKEIKKWANSWYDFLLEHLNKIATTDKHIGDYDLSTVGERITSIFFLQDGELVFLGSYSENSLCRYLDDEEALKIINGLMKNDKLFWESDRTNSSKREVVQSDDKTIYQGKEKCNILRAIRRKIADENNIEYEPIVCHHKGPCMGTCPVCDSEIKYLDDVIQKKKADGEVIYLNGIAEEDMYNALNGNKYCGGRLLS